MAMRLNLFDFTYNVKCILLSWNNCKKCILLSWNIIILINLEGSQDQL